jgi:hypothetical protein
MASSAIVAPRGSAFLTERNNLTPAWHHYLAQIEILTKGITVTDTGAALAQIAERIDTLEKQVTEAEKLFSTRNWGFHYSSGNEITTTNSGMFLTVNHDLGTKHVIARGYNDDFSGGNSTTHVTHVVNEHQVTVLLSAGTYGGNGNPEALVLGLYGYE